MCNHRGAVGVLVALASSVRVFGVYRFSTTVSLGSDIRPKHKDDIRDHVTCIDICLRSFTFYAFIYILISHN